MSLWKIIDSPLFLWQVSTSQMKMREKDKDKQFFNHPLNIRWRDCQGFWRQNKFVSHFSHLCWRKAHAATLQSLLEGLAFKWKVSNYRVERRNSLLIMHVSFRHLWQRAGKFKVRNKWRMMGRKRQSTF